ncbi:hypothetical protein MMC30_000191 [Trapelia coarctata]|nr:hypothetical protein [Trapelia coarctata]
MSPLDAFAAQSRLLAKQLEETQMEEERKSGRRVSRLPPIAVASSLAKQRPGYFRSLTTESRDSAHQERVRPVDEPSGNRREVETPEYRPQSFYPRMSTASPAFSMRAPMEHPMPSPLAHDQTFSTPTEYRPSSRGGYFGAPRAHSPDAVASIRRSFESSQRSPANKSKESFDSMHRPNVLARELSIESTSSRGQYSHGLLTPNPPFARQTPSIRSVGVDSSDDENPGYTPGSSFSNERKLSESSGISGVSMPQSPLSPFMPPPPPHLRSSSHIRSPSAGSDYSTGGNRLSRPAFNFSRPLSRNSQPSMEFPPRQSSTDSPPPKGLPPRQSSSDSQPHRMSEDTASTPASTEKEELFESPEQQVPAVPSYIYAKYSLPRGRMLGRNSIPLENMMPQFEWEQAKKQNQPSQTNSTTKELDASLPTPPHSLESERPTLDSPERPSADLNHSPESAERPSADFHEPRLGRPPPMPNLQHQHRQSMTSMNSGSTIKAPQRATADLSAEDHLSKGIACHERGSLKESTYHLRIAARANNPTAMLLYALACRHGWGMRQNPQEGVQWLRKAMDYASLELENDIEAESNASRGRQLGDVTERKTRRAQFALSVYELGVSHMNGWGIEQDKALALRCFEIASDWGDADAMAEAGFCYAQGVGCKKDLKRAAKYYRDAEKRGMSMVGNSWIYKPKYADESDDRTGRSAKAAPAERKQRDKSRSRNLFSRKKSSA